MTKTKINILPFCLRNMRKIPMANEINIIGEMNTYKSPSNPTMQLP